MDVGPVEAFHEKPDLTEPTWTGIALLKHRVMQEEFGYPLFDKKMDFAYDIFPTGRKEETICIFIRW